MEFVHKAATMDLILVARKEIILYHQATVASFLRLRPFNSFSPVINRFNFHQTP